jgi:xylulokinase
MGDHLVVDIGTSSLKAALLDERGGSVCQTKVSLLNLPGARLESWDARLWDEALRMAVGKLAPRQTPASVTVSGNGPTLVPVDEKGEPAGHALLWLNRQRPGTVPAESESYFLPLAASLRAENPEIFRRTQLFTTCPGYLSFRLSGVPCGISPNGEFSRYMWTPSQVAAWGFEAGLFPPLFVTGTRIGTTTEDAAARFGIGEGVPVYAGGPDYMMAVIGSGAVTPGLSCDRAGTSEGINFCSSRRVDSRALRTLPHAIPGLYTVAGILSSTGRVFEWFRRITNQTGRSYEEILKEIIALPPDSPAPRFFPSRHRGPVWDFNNGIFASLQPEHTHVELGKGVVEAIAYGILDVVETLKNEGCEVTSLRGTGGQYRNMLWNQMKSDILGLPLEIPRIIDAELTGNLCAALVGQGRYAGLAEAAEDLVRIEHVVRPDLRRTALYSRLINDYREVCVLHTSPVGS